MAAVTEGVRGDGLRACALRAGAATGAVALALALAVGGSAQTATAHGAPWSPISRGAACSPDNPTYVGVPACDAAIAAGPPGALANWDDERIHNVFGEDQEFVPDGRLCSGGLANYRGLDLARTDWPATVVTPGTPFEFQYRATIPHRGTFELYLTKPGYDPTKPLTWAELDAKPLAVVPDPPLGNAAYHFTFTWPTDRTGRQVLFSIWRNSQLADTYYSCSDLFFLSQQAPSAAAASRVRSAAHRSSPAAHPAQKKKAAGAPTIRLSVTPVSTSGSSTTDLLLAYTGGAVLAITGVTLAVLMLYLRRHAR